MAHQAEEWRGHERGHCEHFSGFRFMDIYKHCKADGMKFRLVVRWLA